MNNMKILFISLGCDKNLVDSEHMLGLLVEHGFEITDSEEDAEVIVINTCCFIHDAKEESIQNILEMAKYRTAGSCKVLLVTGCMAERYRDEIIEEIPEVDAVLGTNSYDKILDAIQDVLGGDRFQEYADLKGLPKIDAQRVVTTGGHYEYLKIAEGCDKHCTYCIIPKLRGPYRSVPMEELIAEAKTMAEQGVKELVLVAQETTIYGIDLYGKPSLHLLLKELCKIQELYWIRILYCYPEDIYPELVQTMKEEPKVCHYLDLPIQHANDEILRRMGRRTSKQELIDKIDFLRSEMPDITLRTTLITGFPGETKEQHKELLEFINDMEFDRLGVFTYSPEEGTPAAAMELLDGRIITGKTSDLLGSSAALLLNALKDLSGIEHDVHVLSPESIAPIQTLKTKYLGSKNPRLHTDEVLIALSATAAQSEDAQKALSCLPQLKGCQVHSSVMLSDVDRKMFQRLGCDLTCEPKFQ